MAKSKWNKNLAHRIHDLANTPRDVWQTVNTFKEWIQGHHKLADIKASQAMGALKFF